LKVEQVPTLVIPYGITGPYASRMVQIRAVLTLWIRGNRLKVISSRLGDFA